MILVVDDDLAVRTSISLELRQAGYNAMLADGPQQSMELLKQQPIRLVVMDMNFSNETTGEEGLALLKKIKNLYNHIPVILLTGWGSINLAVRGMKAGAVDFIGKPWDAEHLLKAVDINISLSLEREVSHSRKKTGSII